MTLFILERNDCYDWSDETEESCPCASNENRCNGLPPPPGEWQAPGECMLNYCLLEHCILFKVRIGLNQLFHIARYAF